MSKCKDWTCWVFVYGSLKKGGFLYKGREKGLKNATITSDLFDLGAYPAIDIGGKGVVHGELHLIDQWTLQDMIQMEGRCYNLLDITTREGIPCKVFAWDFTMGDLTNAPKVETGFWDAVKDRY